MDPGSVSTGTCVGAPPRRRSGRPPAARRRPAQPRPSGAAGVIAALWAVPDAATRELMVEMHRRWRSGAGDAVAALRAAQDAMRTGDLGDGRWTHPANWAGFTYLGA